MTVTVTITNARSKCVGTSKLCDSPTSSDWLASLGLIELHISVSVPRSCVTVQPPVTGWQV